MKNLLPLEDIEKEESIFSIIKNNFFIGLSIGVIIGFLIVWLLIKFVYKV